MLGLPRSDQGTNHVGQQESSETKRRLHNVIRYGYVNEVDYEKGLLRASVEDGRITTEWIPWLTLRAGPDRYWWAPEKGEVVMLLNPSGEMKAGVAIPAAFSDQNQDGGKPGLLRYRFWDKALIEYDRHDHHLLIDLAELEQEDDEPLPAIHIQTTQCRITVSSDSEGLGVIKMESTGNIELYAGREVRIVSGADVSENEQLASFPDTIEPEKREDVKMSDPLEVPRPERQGDSTFIELNP